MWWYLRTSADHDTHSAGGVHRDGSVVAACGVRFRPQTVDDGGKALPGEPPDPDQICPVCQRVLDDEHLLTEHRATVEHAGAKG